MINIDDRILSEVDENQLFLLCAIAKHMGSNAKAWPSNKTLCETTKWSPNKLQRVKKSAMEAGLLGAESRFQKSAQTSNMYQIKTRRIAVMVNLADIEPHPQNGVSPHPQNDTPAHPQNGVSPHPQNGGTEVLTNEVLKNEVLTNKQAKADKPPKPEKKASEKKESPGVHRMVDIFESQHKRHFLDANGSWIGFTWQAKEFGALKSLKSEFEKRLKGRGLDFSEDSVAESWKNFLQMAADSDRFTVNNWFTPTKLWSNFQAIIQKITQSNGKQQPANNHNQSRADKQRTALENLARDVVANGLR